jgi:drug/metabolite transporter (DMT)-like permease
MYAASMVLIVVSGVLYQLFQKKIAPQANPALSLVVSYAISSALAFMLFALFPLRKPLLEGLKELNVFSLVIALPIVGIELGYLLLYRNGGRLSLSMSLTSTCTTLLLLGIGIFVLGEPLAPKKLIGVACCLVGVFFLQSK